LLLINDILTQFTKIIQIQTEIADWLKQI